MSDNTTFDRVKQWFLNNWVFASIAFIILAYLSVSEIIEATQKNRKNLFGIDKPLVAGNDTVKVGPDKNQQKPLINDRKIYEIIAPFKKEYPDFSKALKLYGEFSKTEIDTFRLRYDIHHTWNILGVINARNFEAEYLNEREKLIEKRKKLIKKGKWEYRYEIDSINNCLMEIVISSMGIHYQTFEMKNGTDEELYSEVEEYTEFIPWEKFMKDPYAIPVHVQLCKCDIKPERFELIFQDLNYYLQKQ